jgi:hypothetical protein
MEDGTFERIAKTIEQAQEATREQLKLRYIQLPSPPKIFTKPDALLVPKLQLMLRCLLGFLDLNQPDMLSTMEYYKALLLSRLLLEGMIDTALLCHEIQRTPEQRNAFRPVEFMLALKVVYDWVSTGGVKAAEVGDPLE